MPRYSLDGPLPRNLPPRDPRLREDRSSSPNQHARKPKIKKGKTQPKKVNLVVDSEHEGVESPNDGKGTLWNHAPSKNNNDRPLKEISAVPDPAPDSSGNLNTTFTSTLAQQSSPSEPMAGGPSKTVNLLLPNISLAPTLPEAPLPAIVVTSTSITSVFITSIPSPSSNPASDTKHNVQSNTTHHFSTVIIILLAVGAAFLLVAAFILFRLCTRQKKRIRLIPSLPILQEALSNEKFDSESPIFGGKERFSTASPRTNTVLWPWTQYQSGIPRPAQAATKHTDIAATASSGQNSQDQHFVSEDKDILSPSLQSATIHKATNATFVQPTLRHLHNAVNHRPSRLSTMSTFMRPVSNYIDSPTPENIGIAVSSGNIATMDAGEDTRVRNESFAQDTGVKANARRSVDRKRVNGAARESVVYRGTEAASPSLAAVSGSIGLSGSAYAQGRARIKAPYGVGSYLRSSSTTAFTGNSGKRVSSVLTEMNPFEDSAYGVPPIPALRRVPDEQGGGTKALTVALGLASPLPSSPDPFQEPPMAGGQKKLPTAHTKLRSPVEASTSLGSLMLSDYRASKTEPDLVANAHSDDGNADRYSTSNFRRRADDKPPRVPSPPLFPSLAQMALAHGNPDDYANYNSPTYSIYGLYDPDRKSRPDGVY